MPSNSYKLSKLAQQHLRDIRAYTLEQFSLAQWQDYKYTLTGGLELLAANPDIGRPCNDIYANGFFFPIGKHTAYYTKERHFILIVAILGQAQIPAHHIKY